MPTVSPSLFGAKTWSDVRSIVAAKLTRKFGGRAAPEDVDDAVSSAMVDLVDYWQHLKSSIDLDNPGRNFHFAIRRATWMSTQFLMQRFEEKRTELQNDPRLIGWEETGTLELDDHRIHGGQALNGGVFACSEPGPEEQACEQEVFEQVHALLASLPHTEYTKWLTDYLAGTTEQEHADREGVRQQAINQRRQRGMERVRRIAQERGLLDNG